MAFLPTIPKGRDVWGWPPVLILVAVITAALAASAVRIVLREESLRRERAAVRERIQELEAERERLRQELGALASPDVIERLAKEELNLKNVGEEVVVVVPDEGAGASREEEPSSGRTLFNWLLSLIGFR